MAAMLNAMLRLAEEADRKEKASGVGVGDEDGDRLEVHVVVEVADFETAMRSLVPSVTLAELTRYERQRTLFEE